MHHWHEQNLPAMKQAVMAEMATWKAANPQATNEKARVAHEAAVHQVRIKFGPAEHAALDVCKKTVTTTAIH